MKPRTAIFILALALLAGAVALESRGGVRAFERGVPGLEGAIWQRSPSGDLSVDEALALAESWRGRDKRRAIDALEEKLDRASLRDPASAETIHLRLADLYRALGLIDAALRHDGAVVDGASSSKVAIEAHLGMARALLRREVHEGALSHVMKAIELSRKSGSNRLHARALLVLGIVLYEQTRFEEALGTLHDATTLASRAGDESLRLEAWLHIGFTRSDRNEDWKAVAAFQNVIQACTSDRDRRLEALALLGLGHTYSKLGEKQRALELYVRAKPLIEAMEDPVSTASLDTGLGYLYTELGDYENAERYYRRAVALNELLRARWGRAANLIHLARLHAATKRPEKAVSAFHAAIADLKQLPDRGMEAAILGELATVLDRLDRHVEAEQAYARALALSERAGSERSQAELLNDIGDYELRQGRVDDARRHFDRALALSRKTDSPFAEAQALFHIARTERESGELDGALDHAERALALVEELRASISSYRLRSSFVASVHELQELHVGLLMDLDRRRPNEGFDRRAFLAAELAKARSLLDHLTEDRDEAHGDPALLRYAQRLRREVAERAAAWDHHRGAEGTEGVPSVPDELEEALLELERVESVLRGPRASPTATSAVADVRVVQSDFVDEDTALLSYFLGRDESYLWVVTPKELRAYRLPPRDTIEAVAHRVHQLLADRAREAGETALAHRRRVEEEERLYGVEAAALAKILLGPALGELSAHRLLVAADGALHQVPFSVLPLPSAGSHSSPLVVRYEVVRLASASIWNAILRRGEPRGGARKQLAVIADPVFDSDDPRVSPTAGEPHPPGTSCGLEPRRLREPLAPGSSANDATALPRLLSTRQEAEAISSLVLPEERLRALGFRANRTLVTDGELAGYDVLHFATHGVSSPERPELSGLALSFVDRNGRPEDGFLRLDDIERLRLPVRLVVLSACSTALGRDVEGEGLVGLVGGFLTAGADGVVASYWNVEDEATAQLMRSFYVGLFSDRLPPPTALQRAQRQMLATRRWQSPYYFGAFEFHGSWR